MRRNLKLFPLVVFLLGLTGCASFHGLREPLYDGEAVVPDDEAIESYQTSQEVIGDEKDYYFRYPFSEEMTADSLSYPNEAPLLLEEGEYVIGEDLPAGRASLLGNESIFTGDNYDVQVGNMIIRDEAGDVYFENLFHSDYGQLVAQVDLIAGHTIEMIGESPEVTVFYAEEFPEDPYVLMDPPEVLVNLEELFVPNPVHLEAEQGPVQLTAGIFEVGEHLAPGQYEIKTVEAPHNTELFVFREGEEARVFELLVNQGEVEDPPQIDLRVGDKIYPNLVARLELQSINIQE